MLLAQLTDTHVVRPGTTYYGTDTTAYLTDAIAAVHALERMPDAVVVTGDLTNFGHADEYERFRGTMSRLRVPYYVVPGNHDDRDRMRAVLPAASFGGSTASRVRFAIDDYDVRLIGLDATAARPWPGAILDEASLAWLETTLAERPGVPAIVCVHQPPFRTGLHYLDVFGFGGGARFRRAVARSGNVGRIICGHIHCVRSATVGGALALSAPSTAPQIVPDVFGRRAFAIDHEAPGFALHAWTPERGFATTIHRRDDTGAYRAVAGPDAPAANVAV